MVENWAKENVVDTLYVQDCMTLAHSTCNGTAHWVLCSNDKTGVNICPIVSTVHLKQQIQSGDKLLLVMATLSGILFVHAAITLICMA